MISSTLQTELIGIPQMGLARIEAVLELIGAGQDPDLEEDREVILRMYEVSKGREGSTFRDHLRLLAIERFDLGEKADHIAEQALYAFNRIRLHRHVLGVDSWYSYIFKLLFGVSIEGHSSEVRRNITLVQRPGGAVEGVVHITLSPGGAVVVTLSTGEQITLEAGTYILTVD